MSAPATRRSTTNRNQRGNTLQRLLRRSWLVTTYGNGSDVLCFHCGTRLTVATVSADRIRPGVDGGTYARTNIRPSCLSCNVADGGRLGRARQLGRTGEPVRLTLPQHRVLIRVRCNPSPHGWTTFTGHQRRTLEILRRHRLVNWWDRPVGSRTELVASPVQPLRPEGVTL